MSTDSTPVGGMLDEPLKKHFPQPKALKALNDLGLHTVEDLLYHFPHRYDNPTATESPSG